MLCFGFILFCYYFYLLCMATEDSEKRALVVPLSVSFTKHANGFCLDTDLLSSAGVETCWSSLSSFLFFGFQEFFFVFWF